MAYKSSKGDREFGDLKNEDDTDTQIDWGSDSITFKTNSAARLIIQNTQLSGSEQCTFGSNILISGDQFLGGALNVSGAVTMTAVSSGSAAGPGSYVAVDPNGALVLDTPAGGGGGGGISFNGSTANGVVTYGNATTADVESNLTFNGSTLAITGDLTSTSNISGSGGFSAGSGVQTTGNISGSGTLNINGAASLNNGLDVLGAITATTTLSSSGGVSAGGGLQATGNLSGSGTLAINGASSFNNEIAVLGTISGSASIRAGNGIQTTGDISGSGELNINDDASFNEDVTILGSLRARQISITHHAYNTTSGHAEKWVPWYALGELNYNSADFTVQAIAPFDGKLLQVAFRPEKPQGGGNTRISLYKATNGTLDLSGSAGRQSVEESIQSNSPSNAAHTAIFTFSASAGTHFSAGDVIGLTVDPFANPGDVNVTCIWEYQMFGV